MDRPALVSDVVVVDDDARVQTLMLHMLERAGLSVVGYDAPLAALEHVLAHPPRVLLTDFSMPELDGAGLARSVRERLGDGSPRILLLTGDPRAVPTKDKHLFDLILGKPWESHVVINTVLPWVRASVRPLAQAG